MTTLATRGANALLVDFTDSKLIRRLTRTYTRTHGGAWVGGRVILTAQSLIFTTNLVNRAIHGRRADVTLPLADVASVSLVAGLGTNIVAIRTAEALLQVRIWRAEEFAVRVADAATEVSREAPISVRRTSESRFVDEVVALILALAN